MQARAVAGGLLAVIVGGAAFVLWPSEASRVRARVVAAAEAISARPGEGDFDWLARLAGLAKALSPDIVVEAGPGGPAIRGREAVAALATQLSTAGGPQRVELSDLEVTLDEALVARRRDGGRARDIGGRAARRRAEPRRSSTATRSASSWPGPPTAG